MIYITGISDNKNISLINRYNKTFNNDSDMYIAQKLKNLVE